MLTWFCAQDAGRLFNIALHRHKSTQGNMMKLDSALPLWSLHHILERPKRIPDQLFFSQMTLTPNWTFVESRLMLNHAYGHSAGSSKLLKDRGWSRHHTWEKHRQEKTCAKVNGACGDCLNRAGEVVNRPCASATPLSWESSTTGCPRAPAAS